MAKSLIKAVFIVAGFSILTRLFGFLFRIYLSRELGAELLGVYQVASSVFMVLIVILSSGLPLAISKLTATYSVSNNKKAQNSVATSALIVGVTVALILCLIILIFKESFGSLFTDSRCIEILITLLPAVVASAVYACFRGSLWGAKDYFSVSVTEFAEQIFRIIAFVVMAEFLFKTLDGAMVAGLSMSVSCILSAVLVVIVYLKKGRKIASPKGYFKPVLKSAVPVTGVRVATSLIQPVIAILFPFMLVKAGYTSEEAMECFGLVMGMTFPLLFLPSTIIGALSFTLIPELSTDIAQNQNKLVLNKVKTSLIFSIFVSAMIIPFYMGAGEAIGVFLYDNATSGVYLARAGWIMIPLGLGNITSSILNAFNLEVKSFVNNILGGVVLLGFIALFSGIMGVDALIWGFGLCMTLTSVLNIIKIKSYTQLNLGLFKPALLMGIFLIPSIMLGYFSYDILSILFPQFLAIALDGVLSAGCFVILCWLFKIIDLTSVIIKLKPKKFAKNV